MFLFYVFSGFALAGIGYIAWQLHTSQQKSDPHLQAELERRMQEIGELKNQITEIKSEKDRLSGQGKELYDRYKSLESEHKIAAKDRDALSAHNARFEAEEDRRQKKHEELIGQQEETRKTLEDEKIRIRREDDERQKQKIEERDRLWNEHEQSVVALLHELCKKPEFSFKGFDNTNLPNGFDGSRKPDFLVEFLEQYIIFDAKVSRSDNFANYIKTQVKETAKKFKGKKEIYPTIFLVVPTEAIAELKNVSYYEHGFTFYVISPDALEPILASLKKITTYEFTDSFDPQERENIINLIAKLDFHINARNTFDVLLARMGAELLRDNAKQHPEIAQEISQQKQKIRIPTLKPSEIKRLVLSMETREEEIEELIAPKPTISKNRLKRAEALLEKE